jgi:SET domain-containing protein
MLLIEAKIGPSLVEGAGVGLFAITDIPEGTIIQKFFPDVDRTMPVEYLDNFSPSAKEFYLKFGRIKDGVVVMFTDNGRFANFSMTPTMGSKLADGAMCDYAARPIKAGEELTSVYGKRK